MTTMTSPVETCTIEVFHPTAEQLLERRIRGEFKEMPGLRLSSQQAPRLWSVDRELCSRNRNVRGHAWSRAGLDQIGLRHTGMCRCIAGIKSERLLEERDRGPRAAGSRIFEGELSAETELARFLGLRSAPGQHLGDNQACQDRNDCAGRGDRPPAWRTRTALRK